MSAETFTAAELELLGRVERGEPRTANLNLLTVAEWEALLDVVCKRAAKYDPYLGELYLTETGRAALESRRVS